MEEQDQAGVLCPQGPIIFKGADAEVKMNEQELTDLD